MVIQCTNCRAKFRIPDSKVKKDDIKARCAKCGQIFMAKVGENAFQEKEALPEICQTTMVHGKTKKALTPGEDEAKLFDSSELELDEKPAGRAQDGPQEPRVREEAGFTNDDTAHLAKKEATREMMPEFSTGVQTEEEVLDEGEPSKPGEKVTRKPVVVRKPLPRRPPESRVKYYVSYPLVVALAVLAGLFFAGLNFPFLDIELLKSRVPGSIKPGLTIVEAHSDYMSSISGEEFFVVFGKIYNNSKKPVRNVWLGGELYTLANRFLLKKRFPCCASMSKAAIYETSYDSYRLAMKKDRIEIVTPYKSLPFVLVFERPDEPVKSFRINILNEQGK